MTQRGGEKSASLGICLLNSLGYLENIKLSVLNLSTNIILKSTFSSMRKSKKMSLLSND